MDSNLVDQIIQMRGTGYSNDQIIQELQNQGLGSQDIFDAITIADMQSGAPVLDDTQIYSSNAPNYDMAQPPRENLQKASLRDEIESVAETIIDEKWQEFEDSIKRILDWKAGIENKIEAFTKEVQDLQRNMDTLNKSVLGKVNDYDKSITDVGTEIKSLQKVFRDVLPSLTENVQELDRISRKLKK